MSEDPSPLQRVPLQTATLNLAARQVSRLQRVTFGRPYWRDRETDDLYERDATTEAVGKRVGKLLITGGKAEKVTDEEYAARKEKDPETISQKKTNEEKAEERGLSRFVLNKTRYWLKKETNDVFELGEEEAIGKKIGKFLRKGAKARIVSDEEYEAEK
jgi:hypothetical protein